MMGTPAAAAPLTAMELVSVLSPKETPHQISILVL